ncbi:MAG: amylo-alpha-1,6-glucosidase [Candidatus Bathyarchaeota archaeon]|nr:amylo-alpha-1,6-glucosidase [Candidatus Bathyarchaeum sp.]
MGLPKICLGQDVLSDVNEALRKEWLVTNGLGGYASSTVLGINTRKYHGLLVAAFNPPVNRWVLLTKLDETLQIRNESYDLGSNEFIDVMHPKGYNFLSEFSVTPFPTFRYDVKGVSVKKTIFMPYMKNATAVIYKVNNPLEEKVSFNVSPLVNSRHIYNTTDKNKIDWTFIKKRHKDAITIEPSDSLSSLILSSSSNASFVDESWWIEKLFFRVDASRSENSIDDNFRPGFFKVSINPKETKKFYVLAVAAKNNTEAQSLFSSFGTELEDIDRLYVGELERRKKLLKQFQEHNAGLELEDWLKWLLQAADSFIVSRASSGTKSVLAGYHWFDDWGRDSLISLSGLTLVTGRFADAQEILLTFERYCSNGIIPNRFSDKAGDIPLYNTVDATLWFFNAVLQYLKYTGDFRFVQEKLWNTLNEIMDYHVQGTIFGIHMDDDGLIAHGPQLTWMDATTIDRFVTPRNGKAVEIQALWYNALKTMQLLATRFNQTDKTQTYSRMAQTAKESFVKKFWNDKNGYLYDVLNKDGADSTLRPNQLIAASLDFPVIDSPKMELVVEAVWKNLWGKYGLKTIPETDSRYIGTYLGNWGHRDSAYHNGTVWAWLLGPFITAFLKTKSHEEYWRNFALKNFLQPLFNVQLYNAGLGTISEIFDGNAPHYSRGCISQAWSVAEPLRAYIEDVALNRPSHEQDVLNSLL